MQDSEKELAAKKVRELVEQMKLYSNPEDIEEMRAVIRKNVPLSMRGYLTAYLYLKSFGSAAPRKAAPRTSSNSNAPARPQNANKADGVTFYINVGKLSKAPAREMVQFICETAKIADEDVLSVSYRQNYSFVTIAKEKAEGIIAAVNGQTYRGRKVKVDYSKEKDAE